MSSILYSNFFVNLNDDPALSPHSTPTLSHSSSDSLVSSPNIDLEDDVDTEDHFDLPEPAIHIPASVPIPETTSLPTSARPRRTSQQGKPAKIQVTNMDDSPMLSEGSSHKGRHLRRGEQLKRNAACSECRRRRTKCDAAKPHCSSCVRHHAYLQKTQPAAYPEDSVVICSYEDDVEPVLPLGHSAKRGVGSDLPSGTSSAPNGRRKSMPAIPVASRSKATRKSSKQSSTTPSERSPTAEVHETSVQDLYNRVAELQSQLYQQQFASSSTSTSSSTPNLSALPFSDDGFPEAMRPGTASTASYSPLTSTQWALDEPLDPLVGYVTGLSQYGSNGQVPTYVSSPLQHTSTAQPPLPFDGFNSGFNLFHTASSSMTTPRHDGMPTWDQQLASMGGMMVPEDTSSTSTGRLTSQIPLSGMLAGPHGFGYTIDQPISPATSTSALFTEQLFPNSDALYHQAIDLMQPHSLEEVLSMNRTLQQHNALIGGAEQVPLTIFGQVGQEDQENPSMGLSQQQQQQQQATSTQMMDWWTTAYLEQEFRDRTDRTDNELPRHSI